MKVVRAARAMAVPEAISSPCSAGVNTRASQIQVAAHAGVAAAVAAENAHPLQAGVLHRHPFGPAGNLVKHQLRLRPAQQ